MTRACEARPDRSASGGPRGLERSGRDRCCPPRPVVDRAAPASTASMASTSDTLCHTHRRAHGSTLAIDFPSKYAASAPFQCISAAHTAKLAATALLFAIFGCGAARGRQWEQRELGRRANMTDRISEWGGGAVKSARAVKIRFPRCPLRPGLGDWNQHSEISSIHTLLTGAESGQRNIPVIEKRYIWPTPRTRMLAGLAPGWSACADLLNQRQQGILTAFSQC